MRWNLHFTPQLSWKNFSSILPLNSSFQSQWRLRSFFIYTLLHIMHCQPSDDNSQNSLMHITLCSFHVDIIHHNCVFSPVVVVFKVQNCTAQKITKSNNGSLAKKRILTQGKYTFCYAGRVKELHNGIGRRWNREFKIYTQKITLNWPAFCFHTHPSALQFVHVMDAAAETLD